MPTFSKLSYIDRIKLLMMAMMTTGHIAWAFVPTDTLLSQWLHFFARSTVILACFLVAEGFRLTSNLTAYAKRLFGFGLLAQIPFMMMSVGLWRLYYEPPALLFAVNVLITLWLCLLSLILCKKIENNRTISIKIGYGFLIILMMILAYLFALDWSYIPILWTIAIYYKRVWGFIGITVILLILSLMVESHTLDTTFSGQIMDWGIVLAIPIMIWYDKFKNHSPKTYRLPRTFFYWYYVVHCLIIGLAVQFTPYATNEYGAIMEQNGEFRNELIE